jgi:ribose/xylose/arabinose/galactoside ABC-type transport system permease subunit
MASVVDMAATEPTTGPQADTVEAPSRGARFVGNRLVQSSVTFVAFLVIFAGLGIWVGSNFLSVSALMLAVHQNVPILLLGLAEVVCLVVGVFDLSIAGVATLACALTVGLKVNQGWPFVPVLLVVFVAGAFVGLVNAFVVERLRVNAFIATLGTSGVCSGIADVYAKGTIISPGVTGPQLPNWFNSLGQFTDKAPAWLIVLGLVGIAITLFFALDRLRPGSASRQRWIFVKILVLAAIAAVLQFALSLSQWVSDMSWMVAAMLLVGFIFWVLVEDTTFGRHIRAIGANRSAAELAGVKTGPQIVKCFVISGVVAALAGVLLAAGQGSATPDAAANFLLPAFAAAFLSTTVLSHGRLTVPGTIVGGIFVVWVGQGLILGGLAATWIYVVNGALLVCAVAMSTVMRKRTA